MRLFIMQLIGYCLALLSSISVALALSATGSRVLAVVGEDPDAYSSFLGSLKERGYATTSLTPEEVSETTLYKFGERMFDHAVILAPNMKQFPKGLEPSTLIDFLRNGGNLMVGLSPKLTESWRGFAREFGLEFGDRDTMLVDHFRYDAQMDPGDHTAVQVGGSRSRAPLDAGGIVPNELVFSKDTLLSQESFLYRGIAHWIGPSPLAFPLLLPPATSYQTDVPMITTSESEGGWAAKGINKLEPLNAVENLLTGADAHSSDTKASLASAIQLRDNSARVMFVGSVEIMQNEIYAMEDRPIQRAVVDDLILWTFQERGVLRVVRRAHERLRAGPEDVRPDYEEEPGVNKMYRIKDTVNYVLEVQQFENGAWKAASQPLDLQLSAIMLDPYVTVPLLPEEGSNSTVYRAILGLPDRHGVFTLRVNWKRHGYTYIREDDVIPVRPFNHNEYPRMLSSSWPYVAGALSTMLGFSTFVALWLIMPLSKLSSKML